MWITCYRLVLSFFILLKTERNTYILGEAKLCRKLLECKKWNKILKFVFIPVLIISIRLRAPPSIGGPGELTPANCLGHPVLPEDAVLAPAHPAANPNSLHANLLHLKYFITVVYYVFKYEKWIVYNVFRFSNI